MRIGLGKVWLWGRRGRALGVRELSGDDDDDIEAKVHMGLGGGGGV